MEDQDAKSTMDLADSEVKKDKTPEGHKDEKSLQGHEDNSEKPDGNSSDKIGLTPNRTDLEANVPASSHTSDTDQKKEDQPGDPNTVNWDGPDDPKNPMNWPAWKVKAHIFLVSAITFIR